MLHLLHLPTALEAALTAIRADRQKCHLMQTVSFAAFGLHFANLLTAVVLGLVIQFLMCIIKMVNELVNW